MFDRSCFRMTGLAMASAIPALLASTLLPISAHADLPDQIWGPTNLTGYLNAIDVSGSARCNGGGTAAVEFNASFALLLGANAVPGSSQSAAVGPVTPPLPLHMPPPPVVPCDGKLQYFATTGTLTPGINLPVALPGQGSGEMTLVRDGQVLASTGVQPITLLLGGNGSAL
ncbi:hypothetical protein [Nocardia huaxiensis]|uniref:hypothetical protein n=1 Tax=Nocardia huaxiensis TaxID=2755382 RepID=UPI001E36AB52|nr:hypothetical protein [Nocardia huaxiensis]UFS98430.1 hypothetical protein LPY97_11265 [Nocardia huaxiensis]